LNNGFKTAKNALEISPIKAARVAANMENNMFKIRQKMFPMARIPIFLFSDPLNGKNMHMKRMLKTSNAWMVSPATCKKLETTA